MGIFHSKTESLIGNIEHTISDLQENWQWVKKGDKTLREIEEYAIALIRELQAQHKKGIGIPEIALRIISFAAELTKEIRAMENSYITRSGRVMPQPDQQNELSIIKKLISEIESLYRQEQEHIKKSQSQDLDESRGKDIPKKILAFFIARANRAEQSNEDFHTFLSKVGTNSDPSSMPDSLYDYIAVRFSGFKEALDPKLKQSLNDELSSVEALSENMPNAKYKQGSGWHHFIINNDSHGRDCKAYITLDYKTFKAMAFIRAVENLTKSGFKGQIKILDRLENMQKRDDTIVIHSNSNEIAARAAQLVVQVLEQNDVRIGGSSRASKYNIAEDFRIPELLNLKITSQYTSFSKGISMVACEMLRGAINQNMGKINSYSFFRDNLVKFLFSDSGPFVDYMRKLNIQF